MSVRDPVSAVTEGLSPRSARLLASCELCPHRCRVDRLSGQAGRCGAPGHVVVFRWGPHGGEEPPISGFRGSGTVFFSTCPLRCVYCQNHPWSHARPPVGFRYTVPELATLFLSLQGMGCHNVNLVTPEPWVPHIVDAVQLARARGLAIPVVYNTSGFVTPETLELVDGVVDIYLTDLRYSSPEQAASLSGTARYHEASRAAAKLMWRLKGPLVVSPEGLALRGVIVRHLLIPGLEATEDVLDFVGRELSRRCHVSLMGQFTPTSLTKDLPPLDGPVPQAQYRRAVATMRRAGFPGWRQVPLPEQGDLLGERMAPTPWPATTLQAWDNAPLASLPRPRR